jgi:hypothetical protein
MQIDVTGFDWHLLRRNGRRPCFNLGSGFGHPGFSFGLRNSPLDHSLVLAGTPER